MTDRRFVRMSKGEAPTTDVDVSQATLNHAFELWINPEIERRRAAGTLPDNFVLHGAQIIMNVGESNEVRLNAEVKAVLSGTCNRPIENGEWVGWDDFSDIRNVMLLEDHDPNAGHVTIIRVRDRWLLAFDFNYNAANVKAHLDGADEFLAVAAHAHTKKFVRPFAENLFAAAELTAKAQLMLRPDSRVLEVKSHGYVASQINLTAHHGNADREFVKALNLLGRLRGRSRYIEGEVDLDENQMATMFQAVSRTLKAVRGRVPERR